jgi:hypothetical protein
MIVFLESTPDCERVFTVEEMQDVLDLVEATIDPSYDPDKKRAAVIALPPGMSARVVGGSNNAIRELKKVMVAQTA